MRRALLGLLLAAASAARADFPVVDSQAWVLSGDERGGERTVYWLDSASLLFIGDERVGGPLEGEPRLAVLRWRPGSAPRVYRRHSDTLCYRPGQIMYAARDRPATSRVFYQGALGNERAVRWSRIDRANCDASYRPPERAQDRAVVPLRREHGILYLGPLSGPGALDNSPVRLVTRAGKEKALPFGRREMGTPEFYEFKGAYLVPLAYFDAKQRLTRSSWPRNADKAAWWLWPDGRTEKIALARDLEEIFPARPGYVHRIMAPGRRSGLYLDAPGERRALVYKGHVTQVAISPDGCKAAFAHAPDARADRWSAKTRRSLKVVDLCAER